MGVSKSTVGMQKTVGSWWTRQSHAHRQRPVCTVDSAHYIHHQTGGIRGCSPGVRRTPVASSPTPDGG